MDAHNHGVIANFDDVDVSAATRKLFAVQVSGAFIMTDSALSWILFGVVSVQMCNYFSRLRTRTGRGREDLWQIVLLAFVWLLLTASAITTLDRSIKINSYHFGDVTWTDDFHNRPHNLQVFILGAATIWCIQILIAARGLTFAKSISPAGHLGLFREVSKWLGLAVCLGWMAAGVAAQHYLYQYETYSEMIEAVINHQAPKFLIFQISWLALGLFGAVLMTANMARDVIAARRFNSTNHPSVKLTNAVLISLLRAMLGNWIYICLAHAIYIFAVLYKRSAIAGRGTACLPLVYAFSLLRMIAAPRDTKSRQLLESEEEDLPRSLERTRSHASRGKRLFGFGKLNTKRPVSTVSMTAGSRPEIGFFSMLRGGLSGPPSRRPSAVVEEGRRPSGSGSTRRRRRSSVKATLSGIQRSTEVLTYSRREKEFQLLEGPKDDTQDEDEEKWVRKNHLLGIGNAVWVETPGIRRPLSANEHYASPQLSPSHEFSVNLTPVASAASPASKAPSRPPIWRHATSSHSQRSSAVRTSRFGTFSAPTAQTPAAVAPLRQGSGAREYATHVGERRADINFINSFPTGPVVSQSCGAYDPDIDIYELSPLDVNPPFSPLTSSTG